MCDYFVIWPYIQGLQEEQPKPIPSCLFVLCCIDHSTDTLIAVLDTTLDLHCHIISSLSVICMHNLCANPKNI